MAWPNRPQGVKIAQSEYLFHRSRYSETNLPDEKHTRQDDLRGRERFRTAATAAIVEVHVIVAEHVEKDLDIPLDRLLHDVQAVGVSGVLPGRLIVESLRDETGGGPDESLTEQPETIRIDDLNHVLHWVKIVEWIHHHQFNVLFLSRLIKGMDGCFPTALGSNILGRPI